MVDNSIYLRSQRQILINNDEKNGNFRIFEDDYDIDVDVSVSLNDRLNSLNNSHVFKKYIGLNRYYVFFVLCVFNPFVSVKIVEGTPSNMHNIFYSKDEKCNNCIYIFYHHVTNKVTNIRYITKN